MAWIQVTVLLPNREKKLGRIETGHSVERIKRDIVKAFALGSPEDYVLYIAPRVDRPLSELVIGDGDTLILMDSMNTKGAAFEPAT